jgi:transposase
MGRAVSIPQRQAIFERAQRSHRAEEIAADLGLRPETVRKLIRRFRTRGLAGIAPGYVRCGSNQTKRANPDLIGVATQLRRDHPTWGAGLIRVILAERHPGRALPSERALQRAFVRADLSPAPAGRRPAAVPRRATQPHETWQVDATEQMTLADGRQASWVRIVDESTGAVLATAVFPPRDLEQRAGRRDPGGPAPGVHTLGDAPTAPGGQRDAVGVAGRLAHRSGAVAGRPGRRSPGESAAASPGQRRRRAVAGHGQAVGGAAPRRVGGGAPGGDRRDGSPPA